MPLDTTHPDYDADIEQLDAALAALHQGHPNTYGLLKISNTSLRASTRRKWEAYRWKLSDEEIRAIGHGDNAARKKALLSLLGPQYVHDVEIVPGVGTIEIEALPEIRDEV